MTHKESYKRSWMRLNNSFSSLCISVINSSEQYLCKLAGCSHQGMRVSYLMICFVYSP